MIGMRNVLMIAGFEMHRLGKERAIPVAIIALVAVSLFTIAVRLPGTIAEAREELISFQRISAFFGGRDDLVPLLAHLPFLSVVSPDDGVIRGHIPQRWRALTTVNSLNSPVAELGNTPLSARDLVRFFSFFLPLFGILLAGSIWPGRELVFTLISLPVTRWQLMFGKVVAVTALLATTFLVIYGLTALILALSPLGLQREVAIRLAYFYLISFQYTLIFSFIGLLLSVLISRRTVALPAALAIFTLLVVIVPALINIGAAHPSRFIEMGRRMRGEVIPVDPLVELGRHTPAALVNFLSSHVTSSIAGRSIKAQFGGLIRDSNIPLHRYIGHLGREFAALGTWVLATLLAAVGAFAAKREVKSGNE